MVSTAAWHHHTPRQLAARLAELASLRVKFKLKIGAMAKKDEIGKEENRETKIRIGQGIFNHEGRKMTRRRGGKDEIGKGENRKTEARGTLSLRVKFKLKLPM